MRRDEAISLAVCIALIVGAVVTFVVLGDNCSKKRCSPGLKPTLMMQHKHVYKCVCLEEPQ